MSLNRVRCNPNETAAFPYFRFELLISMKFHTEIAFAWWDSARQSTLHFTWTPTTLFQKWWSDSPRSRRILCQHAHRTNAANRHASTHTSAHRAYLPTYGDVFIQHFENWSSSAAFVLVAKWKTMTRPEEIPCMCSNAVAEQSADTFTSLTRMSVAAEYFIGSNFPPNARQFLTLARNKHGSAQFLWLSIYFLDKKNRFFVHVQMSFFFLLPKNWFVEFLLCIRNKDLLKYPTY